MQRLTPPIIFSAILFLSIFKIDIFPLAINLAIFFYFVLFCLSYKYYQEFLITHLGLFFINAIILVALFFSPCENGYIKGILSLLMLDLIVIGNYISIKFPRGVIYNFTSYEYIALLYVSVVTVYGLIGEKLNGRVIAFYKEPSHLALVIGPLIGFLVSSNNKFIRYISFILGIFFIIYSPSSTMQILMISAVFFGVLFSDYGKKLRFLSILLLIGFMAFLTAQNEDLTLRVTDILFNPTNINLSSLVYLYGAEEAIINFQQSSWLGLGINMMGCDVDFQNYGYYKNLLIVSGRILENGRVVNYNDGSFLLSKIVSEFGIFSLYFIFIIFLYPIIKLTLISTFGNLNIEMKLVLIFLLTSFFSLFVRGLGYFFEGFLLLLFLSNVYYAKYNESFAK